MLELSQSMTILTILISYIVLDPDMESVVNPSGYHNQQSSGLRQHDISKKVCAAEKIKDLCYNK